MSEPAEDTPTILFSRSVTTNHFGKCTEEIKTRVPYELKEGFARIASDAGMTESEYLRKMLELKVFGLDMVRKIHDEQLRQVAGIGRERS
ncbi:MAG: hypothetical protein A2143_00650 [Gallionellales bacterium RBG_16_57_15]|nr:MAG: hypothetical protein A2143_00650 [Gallionellales bacterium RBG_16_57_15]